MNMKCSLLVFFGVFVTCLASCSTELGGTASIADLIVDASSSDTELPGRGPATVVENLDGEVAVVLPGDGGVGDFVVEGTGGTMVTGTGGTTVVGTGGSLVMGTGGTMATGTGGATVVGTGGTQITGTGGVVVKGTGGDMGTVISCGSGVGVGGGTGTGGLSSGCSITDHSTTTLVASCAGAPFVSDGGGWFFFSKGGSDMLGAHGEVAKSTSVAVIAVPIGCTDGGLQGTGTLMEKANQGATVGFYLGKAPAATTTGITFSYQATTDIQFFAGTQATSYTGTIGQLNGSPNTALCAGTAPGAKSASYTLSATGTAIVVGTGWKTVTLRWGCMTGTAALPTAVPVPTEIIFFQWGKYGTTASTFQVAVKSVSYSTN
jgi:hypothetical protein